MKVKSEWIIPKTLTLGTPSKTKTFEQAADKSINKQIERVSTQKWKGIRKEIHRYRKLHENYRRRTGYTNRKRRRGNTNENN